LNGRQGSYTLGKKTPWKSNQTTKRGKEGGGKKGEDSVRAEHKWEEKLFSHKRKYLRQKNSWGGNVLDARLQGEKELPGDSGKEGKSHQARGVKRERNNSRPQTAKILRFRKGKKGKGDPGGMSLGKSVCGKRRNVKWSACFYWFEKVGDKICQPGCQGDVG